MSRADTPRPDPSHGAGQRPLPSGCGLRSPKISNRHLDLLVIVYIRQSSLQQVFQHVESRARQYELVEWATAHGWPADRVLVIDDDQGLGGTEASQRGGFQRLLAEVGLGHVGLVLGLEMSRLARSSVDFQQLLELCALRGTLIADQDGVYDPREANDRLLLGLKGTMSEFELITLRQRLVDGRNHKAQRAALFHGAAIGYVKVGREQIELDPDERVRAVVALIFAKFAELGTLGALRRYLRQNEVLVGVRPQTGARRGQVQWRRASRSTLTRILHNPLYAGAYAYGRTQSAGRAPGRRTVRHLAMPQWRVLKKDCLPAYISWEHYQENQERLRSNRKVKGPGTSRHGAALLAGLVACGRCGRGMRTRYSRGGHPCYRCMADQEQGGPRGCGSLTAAAVDAVVAEQVLRALEPAARELHLQAVEEIEKERERLDRHWQGRLEQLRYEAARVERQY